MRMGRVGIVKAAIVKAFAGKRGLKVAAIAEGVKKTLVRDVGFKGYGGSEATVLFDCRRALASMQEDGFARFVGVKAQGAWSVYARKRREA